MEWGFRKKTGRLIQMEFCHHFGDKPVVRFPLQAIRIVFRVR